MDRRHDRGGGERRIPPPVRRDATSESTRDRGRRDGPSGADRTEERGRQDRFWWGGGTIAVAVLAPLAVPALVSSIARSIRGARSPVLWASARRLAHDAAHLSRIAAVLCVLIIVVSIAVSMWGSSVAAQHESSADTSTVRTISWRGDLRTGCTHPVGRVRSAAHRLAHRRRPGDRERRSPEPTGRRVHSGPDQHRTASADYRSSAGGKRSNPWTPICRHHCRSRNGSSQARCSRS